MKQIWRLSVVAILATAGAASNAQSWSTLGNTGTNPNTNFLGTINNRALVLRTTNIERMRIGPNGNVGIGTNKPQGKLHVDGGTPLTLANAGYAVIGTTSGLNTGFDNQIIQARNNGSAASLYLNYYGGTTFIGNSAYDNSLVVNGAGYSINGYASSSGGATAINGVAPSDGFGVAGSGFYGVYGYSSSGGYGVYGQGANSSYGVEGYSVSAIGIYGATGNSSSYAGFFVGNVYTTGTYLPSDEKLKQDIQDFSSAMGIIDQLHPKKYQYRQDGNYKQMNLSQGIHYGLIAQDVEKVLPDLVKNSTFDIMKPAEYKVAKDPKDLNAQSTVSMMTKSGEAIDFKALNYAELIPIIIKGMQEQQTVIEQQQQQINDLKQLVQTLVVSNADKNLPVNASAAWLKQNTPNPFNQNTNVRCFVPSSVKQAQLIVCALDGHQLKSFTLTAGANEVNIAAGTLPSGQYVYSLLIDGKNIDSKKMILTK